MNYCIVIILCIFCVVVSLKYLLLAREIKGLSKSLDDINEDNNNQKVMVYTRNKYIKNISNLINSKLNKFMRISQREKALEDTRKQMISNISHDLRTPLTSMLGYLEAVQKDKELEEEKKIEYINIAYNKAKGLHELMEDFFQLSKLDADDVVMKFEKVNISEKIREIIVGYYHEFNSNGIEPHINMPGEDLYVLGDNKSIDRILLNLLSNALRYGESKCKIGVEVFQKKSQIEVKVWNTGKGIEEKDIPYIFERLYTAIPSRNRKFQGSGLGLTITKKLVEKHNGNIYVESIVNDKTTFTFTLPEFKSI